MSVYHHDLKLPEKRAAPACRSSFLRPARILIVLFLCVLFLAASASAAEIVLNASTIGQYASGISNKNTEPVTITLEDNVAIASTEYAGIESVAPVTIRSPAGKTLSISVKNNSVLLYGITAPAVTVESGSLNITVRGNNDAERGNAFGIAAINGNVTIAGGSVRTDVETSGHKNKGIYASRYIVITGGTVVTDERGGSNTFGLDGGDVENGNSDGGVAISGGQVFTTSNGGKNRNIGIDSKFGTVSISGNPVILIADNGSGKAQNYVYNPNITTISGGNAVVFTAENGNYTLRKNAILAQNATLLPGKTFEIPAGTTMAIASGTGLVTPGTTTLLFGGNYGTFTYTRSFAGADGAEIYEGSVPTPQSALPGALILVGLISAVFLMRIRK
jgi:hypothetical protein